MLSKSLTVTVCILCRKQVAKISFRIWCSAWSHFIIIKIKNSFHSVASYLLWRHSLTQCIKTPTRSIFRTQNETIHVSLSKFSMCLLTLKDNRIVRSAQQKSNQHFPYYGLFPPTETETETDPCTENFPACYVALCRTFSTGTEMETETERWRLSLMVTVPILGTDLCPNFTIF